MDDIIYPFELPLTIISVFNIVYFTFNILGRCTDVLCRLLCRDSGSSGSSVDVCRDLVRSVSQKREQAVWFARRLFAKNKETRTSMSQLFATMVCRLDVSDCVQDARPALAEILADVSSDDEQMYGLEAGGAGETKNSTMDDALSKMMKKKKKKERPPPTVVSFLLLLESIQEEVMEKHINNEEYFDLYYRMCCLGEKNSPHILRAMYDHEVISALVHLYVLCSYEF